MLEFNIKNQTISRIDKFSPATDSVDYLTAQFNFLTEDWADKTKKALFRSGTVSYEAAINSSGICVVPWEVLVSPENKFSALSGGCIKMFVSVVGVSGTVTLPTKEVRVELSMSGLTESLNGADPTPSLWQQFVDTVTADNDETEAAIKQSNAEAVAVFTKKTEEVKTAAADIKAYDESIKNNYANSFKGEASGEVIRVDDVSPIEHTVKARAVGKNLFPTMLDEAETTVNGVTYTFNGDGTITINGTSDTDVSASFGFIKSGSQIPIKKGTTVTISGVKNETSINTHRIRLFTDTGTVWTNGGLRGDYTQTTTVTVEEDCVITGGYIQVYVGRTVENVVVKPQLEIGSEATDFTPYIDPSTVTLTRCGKNLINHNLMKSQVTLNGVTITRSEDTIIFDGTLTTDSVLYNTAFCVCGGVNNDYTLFYKHISGTVTGMASLCVGDSNSPDEARQSWGNLALKSEDNRYTLKTIKPYIKDMWIYAKAGTVFSNFTIKVQLEQGNAQIEYETYNGATYTPSADGTCDVISVSPTMTLLTNTEGINIECEYNRDTTAVMGDLKACLEEIKNIQNTLIGGAS